MSNNNHYVGSFDFSSLYPTAMKDFSLDTKLMNELKRQNLLKQRKEKLEQIYEIQRKIN